MKASAQHSKVASVSGASATAQLVGKPMKTIVDNRKKTLQMNALNKSIQVGQLKAVSAPRISSNAGVIQMKGERTALENTRTPSPVTGSAIRRGNRRDSISDTNGFSSAALRTFRENRASIQTYVLNALVTNNGYSPVAAQAVYSANEAFINALAIKLVNVGNCGEFGEVVYSNLLQNTTGQWVYRCQLVNRPNSNDSYDHCFVITYPQDVNSIANMDKSIATVADAWDGYKIVTLQQFMNGDNCYRAALQDGNIGICNKASAQGNALPNAIRVHVESWAQGFANTFYNNGSLNALAATHMTSINDPGMRFFSTNGSNVAGIADGRSFMDKMINSTDAEKVSIVNHATAVEIVSFVSIASRAQVVEVIRLCNSNAARATILHALNNTQLLEVFNSVSSFEQAFLRASDTRCPAPVVTPAEPMDVEY
jgi:hypothetical protein